MIKNDTFTHVFPPVPLTPSASLSWVTTNTAAIAASQNSARFDQTDPSPRLIRSWQCQDLSIIPSIRQTDSSSSLTYSKIRKFSDLTTSTQRQYGALIRGKALIPATTTNVSTNVTKLRRSKPSDLTGIATTDPASITNTADTSKNSPCTCCCCCGTRTVGHIIEDDDTTHTHSHKTNTNTHHTVRTPTSFCPTCAPTCAKNEFTTTTTSRECSQGDLIEYHDEDVLRRRSRKANIANSHASESRPVVKVSGWLKGCQEDE
ncbi:hypothetical protein HDU76_009394 [Blyttiomyces sp. JEL0837]|nr:hypothetical protein HDU76_009394 [Blyttiomyces sp. JEL0837]